MSKTYAIVDLANTYSKARHVTRGSIEDRVGLAIHITITSIHKAWRDFNADHVVICLEGRSWRKSFFPKYKLNRTVAREKLTENEQLEDELFFKVLNEIQSFMIERTNSTVIQHPELEADDLIAGWVQNHPNDEHVIISSDSDFAQLVSTNVKQYNGITDTLTTINGYFDGKGKPIKEKKTGKPKAPPDPKWLLFEKCIRGDKSDNVFSAYPGVRTKGSKNKVGLLQAYADMDKKGYDWNCLMLQRWTDHEGREHRVLDDYVRNRQLIDLSAQPDDVRKKIDETVLSVETKHVKQVGIHLMKLCGRWNLETLSQNAESIAKMFAAKYEKEHD